MVRNNRDNVVVVKEMLNKRNEDSDPTTEIVALSFDKGIEGGDFRDFVGNVDDVVKDNIVTLCLFPPLTCLCKKQKLFCFV